MEKTYFEKLRKLTGSAAAPTLADFSQQLSDLVEEYKATNLATIQEPLKMLRVTALETLTATRDFKQFDHPEHGKMLRAVGTGMETKEQRIAKSLCEALGRLQSAHTGLLPAGKAPPTPAELDATVARWKKLFVGGTPPADQASPSEWSKWTTWKAIVAVLKSGEIDGTRSTLAKHYSPYIQTEKRRYRVNLTTLKPYDHHAESLIRQVIGVDK